MAISKAKQAARAKKFYGMKKIGKGTKMSWISTRNKHGWSLGLALEGGTLWLRNVRFTTEAEIDRAMRSRIVFVDTTDLK